MKKSTVTNPEEIQHYIKDIKKIPVISHDRQDEIFELLKTKDITKQEKKLLYDELVRGNLRFVISVAKMYQNQGLSIMDLISEGNIGLIKAAERFDPTSGLKFISYAVWWVKCILRYIPPSEGVERTTPDTKDTKIDQSYVS